MKFIAGAFKSLSSYDEKQPFADVVLGLVLKSLWAFDLTYFKSMIYISILLEKGQFSVNILITVNIEMKYWVSLD